MPDIITPNAKLCNWDGCDGKHTARGWCEFHYIRWRRGIPLGQPKRPHSSSGRSICTLDGCENVVMGHGYCSGHYTRWRRGQPIDGPLRPQIHQCVVDGCGRDISHRPKQARFCEECADRRKREQCAQSRDKLNPIYLANPEYVAHKNDKTRERYKANPEKYRVYARQWIAENKQKVLALAKAWRQANPAKVREIERRRRARKNGVASERIGPEFLGVLIERQGNKCAGCARKFTKTLRPTFDHIVPLSKGGPHAESNLQVMCLSCNSSKHANDETAWRRRKGMLL